MLIFTFINQHIMYMYIDQCSIQTLLYFSSSKLLDSVSQLLHKLYFKQTAIFSETSWKNDGPKSLLVVQSILSRRFQPDSQKISLVVERKEKSQIFFLILRTCVFRNIIQKICVASPAYELRISWLHKVNNFHKREVSLPLEAPQLILNEFQQGNWPQKRIQKIVTLNTKRNEPTLILEKASNLYYLNEEICSQRWKNLFQMRKLEFYVVLQQKGRTRSMRIIQLPDEAKLLKLRQIKFQQKAFQNYIEREREKRLLVYFSHKVKHQNYLTKLIRKNKWKKIVKICQKVLKSSDYDLKRTTVFYSLLAYRCLNQVQNFNIVFNFYLQTQVEEIRDDKTLDFYLEVVEKFQNLRQAHICMNLLERIIKGIYFRVREDQLQKLVICALSLIKFQTFYELYQLMNKHKFKDNYCSIITELILCTNYKFNYHQHLQLPKIKYKKSPLIFSSLNLINYLYSSLWQNNDNIELILLNLILVGKAISLHDSVLNTIQFLMRFKFFQNLLKHQNNFYTKEADKFFVSVLDQTFSKHIPAKQAEKVLTTLLIMTLLDPCSCINKLLKPKTKAFIIEKITKLKLPDEGKRKENEELKWVISQFEKVEKALVRKKKFIEKLNRINRIVDKIQLMFEMMYLSMTSCEEFMESSVHDFLSCFKILNKAKKVFEESMSRRRINQMKGKMLYRKVNQLFII